MKILLIEDEVLLANSLKTMLSAKGFQVEAVYDGETGADYALLGVYDLLILDVMMPGTDGITVLQEYRNAGGDIPILILTAKSELEDKVQGLDSGADETIVNEGFIGTLAD